MNNKKIVIFGATSSIAQATLKLFAKEGYECCLVARDGEKLKIIADDLSTRSSNSVLTFEADLSDSSIHPQLLTNISTQFGDFDSVLFAYGTLSKQEICEKDISETFNEFNINLLSAISLLTIIANIFEEKSSGQIVVISSVAGERGRQSNYIYGSAKGALSIFLQGLRNRLDKKNVNVLTIKPGFVDTPMTKDFKKGLLWVSPDKIAKGIVAAMKKRRDIVYLPWFWQWIMIIIRIIPERIFKKLSL